MCTVTVHCTDSAVQIESGNIRVLSFLPSFFHCRCLCFGAQIHRPWYILRIRIRYTQSESYYSKFTKDYYACMHRSQHCLPQTSEPESIIMWKMTRPCTTNQYELGAFCTSSEGQCKTCIVCCYVATLCVRTILSFILLIYRYIYISVN